MADHFDDDEQDEPRPVEQNILMVAPPSFDQRTVVAPLPSANAPIVFFDTAAYFARMPGYGASITLTTQRQTSDEAGKVTEDRVITALLRAPFPALLQLRDNLTAILEDELKHAAAQKPSGMAH